MRKYAALVKLRHKGADGRYRNIEEGEIFSDISDSDGDALISAGAAMLMCEEIPIDSDEIAITPEEQAEIAAEITGESKRRRGGKK